MIFKVYKKISNVEGENNLYDYFIFGCWCSRTLSHDKPSCIDTDVVVESAFQHFYIWSVCIYAPLVHYYRSSSLLLLCLPHSGCSADQVLHPVQDACKSSSSFNSLVFSASTLMVPPPTIS